MLHVQIHNEIVYIWNSYYYVRKDHPWYKLAEKRNLTSIEESKAILFGFKPLRVVY